MADTEPLLTPAAGQNCRVSWVSLLWRSPRTLAEAVAVGGLGGAVLFTVVCFAKGQGWQQALIWSVPVSVAWIGLGVLGAHVRSSGSAGAGFGRLIPVGLVGMGVSVAIVILALLHKGQPNDFAR